MRMGRGGTAGWWSGVAVCAAFALPSGAMAADAGSVQVLAHESFRPLPAVAVTGSAKPSAGSLRTLKFDAFGRRFSLLLEPNPRLTPGAADAGPALSLYQGTVENVPGSWVRMSAKGQAIRGAFWDGRELYLVDSAAAVGRTDAGADANVIFRMSDVESPAGSTFCTAAPESLQGKGAYDRMLKELKNSPVIMQATGATLRLEISAVADQLFRARYASDQQARDEILTRINIVDGIYSSQLQVEIQVPTMNIGDEVAGELSGDADPNVLIRELGQLRERTPVLRARGLTHLFTGRDLGGPTVHTVGIAYNDALCSARYGAGLTQTSTSTVIDALITAHEIGHNFGAHHDGDASHECASTPLGQYLMSPSVSQNAQTFSECSLTRMRSRIPAATCLMPLSAPDLEVPPDLGTSSHAVGAPFAWTLTVANKGGSIAYDSTATLEVPPVVSVNDAFVVGGTCTRSSVGRVQCSVGDIPAGGSRAVNLSLSSDVLGSNSISARVFAPDDIHTANNLGDGTLVIDPEADLAVSAQAPSSVVAGNTATASFTVTNSASIEVSAVHIAVTVSGGVAVASGEITGGSCSVSGSAAQCSLPSLAGGASATGTLTLNAVTSGTASLTAVVSGGYVDPTAGNNTAESSISVVPGPTGTGPGKSKGGGGSLQAWLLTALGTLAGLRRRRASRLLP